jgi:pimeloyl-ACP methyl ester carboxylesterase
MGVDIETLKLHSRYEDRELGIYEEFVQPVLGLGRTVAVLSRPLEGQKPVGWVICHSLALEQIHLGRLDVLAARALSAAGFPVLRFHGQGYGDSQNSMEVIGLTSHLADAIDAVSVLADRTGVERVGIAGARFGGMVAALVADRLRLPLMALWEPVVKGPTYMRDFLRSELLSQIAQGEGGGGSDEMDHLRTDLTTQGWADIKGFRLSREAHDEIAAVDLTRDLQSFEGSALVVGVSRAERPNAGLVRLTERLASLGASASLEIAQSAFAAQFGQYRFQTVDGGRGKRDVQIELNERIVEVTVSWAARQVEAIGEEEVLA